MRIDCHVSIRRKRRSLFLYNGCQATIEGKQGEFGSCGISTPLLLHWRRSHSVFTYAVLLQDAFLSFPNSSRLHNNHGSLCFLIKDTQQVIHRHQQ